MKERIVSSRDLAHSLGVDTNVVWRAKRALNITPVVPKGRKLSIKSPDLYNMDMARLIVKWIKKQQES